MDETLKADLRLSHGFLNLVSAGYEGIYVYLNARRKLAPADFGPDALEKLAPALDRIHGWWDDFEACRPLVTHATLDSPPEPFLLVRNWLEITKNHLRSLVNGLASTSQAEGLAEDLPAVHLRAAAACETAYSREHFVRGLIRCGEVMGDETVADHWREHLPACHADVATAHRHLALAEQMGAPPDAAAAGWLLDETLALPAVLAQRVGDINGILAQIDGGLTYGRADIPEARAAEWSARGFPPDEAGRWYGVGYEPDQARRWIDGGVPDPVRAFEFMLRGFTAEDAGGWLRAGTGAREAAARRQQGLGPGDEPSS